MNKTLSVDVLKLYLGCECETPYGKMILSSLDLGSKHKAWFNEGFKQNKKILNSHGLAGKSFPRSKFKPLLTTLSSMSDDHKRKIFDTAWPKPAGLWAITDTGKESVIEDLFEFGEGSSLAERVREYMTFDKWNLLINKARSLGYDCDNLIEQGLALDSTKSPTHS